MKTKDDKYPRYEERKVSVLKAHPDGVRTHTNDSLYLLGKSLEEFGVIRPLVVNAKTGTVLDGDLTLAALRDAGAEVAPCWVVDVPEEMEDVVHLALNNHAGEWQWEPVSKLLKSLQERKHPLGLTGFHESDYGPLVEADWTVPVKGPMDGASEASQVRLFE